MLDSVTINALTSALSGLSARQTATANNIANINTPGYKASKMVFADYMTKPKTMSERMDMVEDYGNFRVTANGPIKVTGNPLDVALEGPGYFGVQGPGGKQMYTRAGSFALDADGNLVTQQGYKVLDTGGAPIAMTPGTKDIVIDQTGSIATKDGTVSQLMVQEFPNVQTLTPVGDTLYQTSDAGTPSTKTKVIQNSLEGSNTQGVVEMTDMIDVSRSYENVAKMLQNEHDRIRSTIKDLTSNA